MSERILYNKVCILITLTIFTSVNVEIQRAKLWNIYNFVRKKEWHVILKVSICVIDQLSMETHIVRVFKIV